MLRPSGFQHSGLRVFIPSPCDSYWIFPCCFSSASAITLFALQPFCNFWRFLLWVLFTTLYFKITEQPVDVLSKIRPQDAYPLHIQTRLHSWSAITHGPVSQSASKSLTCCSSIAHSRYSWRRITHNFGLFSILLAIWPHAVNPFPIHTIYDGWWGTHLRARTHCANNTATCRISIALSH